MSTTTRKTVTLAEIAKKAHVPPRTARRKLRNASRGEVPMHLGGFRWEWKVNDAKRVVEYIRD